MAQELLADQSLDRQQELAALARMVTFARQTAHALNAELPAHCLDMALDALIEELKIAGVDVGLIAGCCDGSARKAIH